jgi:pimeloyl-ACP methyl ester carboxylesterase/cell wall-associated NlpC family hydrolase
MAQIEINGAQIYYETFGEDRPGQAPVLLIHGSKVTGKEDWGLVAPLLARRRQVIVPDCRGHGRSSNPNLTYSFKEMADDMAALVHLLGYKRAHIIGHSNGGNVALVVLMEHPEVVQSAVLQAANSYISPDLLEREQSVFDPDRMAREAPQLRDRLIALHGPTHGPDYWRDLLHLTMQETMTQPNYTPEDLQRVKRPTLAVQGENDQANAPARHAQFIAQHIPNAELWTPTGVGHDVHLEVMFQWIERIESFLDRRGDEVNDALYRLGQERFADGREWIYDLRAKTDPAAMDKVTLSGTVLLEPQRQAAFEQVTAALEAQGQKAQINAAGVQALLGDNAPWALVNRAVTDLRREPRRLSERVSQALLGETLRILIDGGDWVFVRLERDGYLGWVQANTLHRVTQAEAGDYQAACQVRVVADLLPAFRSPERPAGDQAGRLPFGACVPVAAEQSHAICLRLPDGRQWWAASTGLLLRKDWPRPDAAGKAFVLDLIRPFVGIPYLWGGRSPYGYDCSGLAGAYWGFMGVDLPRDADQQFRLGATVEGQPLPGDLLFFGERDDDQPGDRFASISHVAISLGGDEVIHANGSANGVSINSLNLGSPIYNAWLHKNLAGIRRYA